MGLRLYEIQFVILKFQEARVAPLCPQLVADEQSLISCNLVLVNMALWPDLIDSHQHPSLP